MLKIFILAEEALKHEWFNLIHKTKTDHFIPLNIVERLRRMCVTILISSVLHQSTQK